MASPPMLSIGPLVLSPLNSDWRGESGSRDLVTPPESFTVYDLNTVVLENSRIHAQLNTDQLPDQVSITRFDQIDENGIPVGAGRDEDCSTSSTCSYGFNPKESVVDVLITVTPEDKVIIIHVYYVRPNVELSDSGSSEPVIHVSRIETNYASYGFRVTDRPSTK
ncbi:hypothetical protein FYJ24_02755 [Actinomycetaceae bacterium WB03_NA08]|uniref:Uncharacterized protein n=1 Tax=Scrofimicrobium canadense TaxID=2652290 RepID=A0A6N7W6C0_9ACTO|nr:hypothetical protein [Scrofimicrobium canadense]MSS83698.1 hypothetical protein [Scrofimicrobium canadense]